MNWGMTALLTLQSRTVRLRRLERPHDYCWAHRTASDVPSIAHNFCLYLGSELDRQNDPDQDNSLRDGNKATGLGMGLRVSV